MGTGLWLLIAGGVLVALLILWPKLKAWLPASWMGGVTNVIDTGSHGTTDIIMSGAEETLVIGGWANGDLDYITLVYACRKRREGWNQPPATVTLATPTPTVTLDAISARLANIEAKLPPTVQGG